MAIATILKIIWETRLYYDVDKDVRYNVNAYHVNEDITEMGSRAVDILEAGLMTSRAHCTLVYA